MDHTDDKPKRMRVDEAGVRDFLSGFLAGEEKTAAEAVHREEIFPDETAASLKSAVIDALSEIYDPEIPVNIYELGLIYGVEIDDRNCAHVTMTLTTPHCPVAESMPGEVETKVRMVDGVEDCEVNLVWEPKWDQSLMSEAARLELGLL